MDDGIMAIFGMPLAERVAFRLRRGVNPFADAQIALEETTIPNAREAFLNYHRARPSSGGLLAGKSAFASARKRRNS